MRISWTAVSQGYIAPGERENSIRLMPFTSYTYMTDGRTWVPSRPYLFQPQARACGRIGERTRSASRSNQRSLMGTWALLFQIRTSDLSRARGATRSGIAGGLPSWKPMEALRCECHTPRKFSCRRSMSGKKISRARCKPAGRGPTTSRRTPKSGNRCMGGEADLAAITWPLGPCKDGPGATATGPNGARAPFDNSLRYLTQSDITGDGDLIWRSVSGYIATIRNLAPSPKASPRGTPSHAERWLAVQLPRAARQGRVMPGACRGVAMNWTWGQPRDPPQRH